MPPLPEAIRLVLASCAPRFSHRVWPDAQCLRVGALLAPGARTVTAALRVVGLSRERHVTTSHRVLNRATWSARQAGRLRLGRLVTSVVPPGAPLVLGADDTGERRRGRQITAKGCYRDAVRSTRKHVIPCFGLQGVVMMRLVPVPWSRRVWALPWLTAWCRPAAQAPQRRHKTSVDWVRQMMRHARRWLPGRSLVLVVDGGCAAVSLALAWVKSQVTMVSRLRWDAVLYHPPGPQPQGTRGHKPTRGNANAACKPGQNARIRAGRP
jgi:DDE superfamily endonuclease